MTHYNDLPKGPERAKARSQHFRERLAESRKRESYEPDTIGGLDHRKASKNAAVEGGKADGV